MDAAEPASAARRTAAHPRAGVFRRGGRGRVVGAAGAARGRRARRGRSHHPLAYTFWVWRAGRVRQGAGGPGGSPAGQLRSDDGVRHGRVREHGA